jgi:hypothetical protein
MAWQGCMCAKHPTVLVTGVLLLPPGLQLAVAAGAGAGVQFRRCSSMEQGSLA